MNIDVSNAHCGPRILFLDHVWLRVVCQTKTARTVAEPSSSPPGGGARFGRSRSESWGLAIGGRLADRPASPRDRARERKRPRGALAYLRRGGSRPSFPSLTLADVWPNTSP